MDLLYLRNNRYYFRYQLPNELRALSGKRELKISLGTSLIREARAKSAPLYELALQIKALHGQFQMAKVSEQVVLQELDRILKAKIQYFRENDMPRTPFEVETFKQQIQQQYEQANRDMMWKPLPDAAFQDDIGFIYETVVEKIDIPNDRELRSAIGERRRELVFKFSEYLSVLFGDEKNKLEKLKAIESFYEGDLQTQQHKPDNLENNSPLLSELLPEYKAHKKKMGDWQEGRENEYFIPLDELLIIVGDQPIKNINRALARKYLDVISQLPKNRTRSKAYKNKSIHQLLEMDIPAEDQMSTKTIQDRKIIVGNFFNWCEIEKELDITNPFKQMATAKSNKAKSERTSFSASDLQKLFKPSVAARHDKTWKFWCPLIALYSGSRQTEHAQLLKSDIKQSDSGTWYFDFRVEEGSDKKLKTNAAQRMTPIHPDLIQMGFMDYVNGLPEGSRVFPDLNKGVRGWGQAVSKWFNGSGSKSSSFKVKAGIDDPNKVYHSFRHTTISHLEHKLNLPHEKVARIVGHDVSSSMGVTAGYSHPEVEDLALLIEPLSFGLDVEGLSEAWKVVREGIQ